MATTNNGATVDNLNVLDTSSADGTSIMLLEVANALLSNTNATQTVTIYTSFWSGQLGLTFLVSNTSSSGPIVTNFYTLYGAGTDNFVLYQTDQYGNALVSNAVASFTATTTQAFLNSI